MAGDGHGRALLCGCSYGPVARTRRLPIVGPAPCRLLLAVGGHSVTPSFGGRASPLTIDGTGRERSRAARP